MPGQAGACLDQLDPAFRAAPPENACRRVVCTGAQPRASTCRHVLYAEAHMHTDARARLDWAAPGNRTRNWPGDTLAATLKAACRVMSDLENCRSVTHYSGPRL